MENIPKPQLIKLSSKPLAKERRNHEACPFMLISQYIAIRPKYKSTEEQFFVFRDLTPVTPFHMRHTLQMALHQGGFDAKSYCTQSMHAGHTTDLLEYGISVETIKKLGRWTSNAVYKYLH